MHRIAHSHKHSLTTVLKGSLPCIYMIHSPLILSSLVMEFWLTSMDIALASGKIASIKRGRHGYVTHFYLQVICWSFLRQLLRGELLQNLELNTGLKINKEMGKIYFSKRCNHKEDLRDLIGFQ